MSSFAEQSYRIKLLEQLPEKQLDLYLCDCVKTVLYLLTEYDDGEETAQRVAKIADKDVLNNCELHLKYFFKIFHNASDFFKIFHNASDKAYSVVTAIDLAFTPPKDMWKNVSVCYWVAWASNEEKAFDWTKVETLYKQAFNEGKLFLEHYKNYDTVNLAKYIRNYKEFDLMPILADALMDAGCPEEDAEVVRSGTGLSNWALYHLEFDNEDT